MNYTRWIEENLPNLQGESSAETYALIKQARKSARIYILIVRVTLLVAVVLLAPYFGAPLGVYLFQGIYGWLLAVFAFTIAEMLGSILEHLIVTNRIRRISRAGHGGI